MIKSSGKGPNLNLISTLDSIAALDGFFNPSKLQFPPLLEVVVRINWSDLLKALCQAHRVSKDVHFY